MLRPVEDTLPPLDLTGLSEEKKKEALQGSGFRPDPYSHIIAARIRPKKDGKVNAIYVADCDLISNVFFDLRRDQWLNLNLDNVSFVLNAVDSLAGEKSFLELRRRKPPHPSLTKIEEKKDVLAAQAARSRQRSQGQVHQTARKIPRGDRRSRKQNSTATRDLSMYEKLRQVGMTLESEKRRLQGEMQIN